MSFQTHSRFFINISIDRCRERHKNNIFISHLFVHSAATASSSVDSLSPGSEGAGALQVLSFYFKGVLQANFPHIIHHESVVQLNSPSEPTLRLSEGSSFRRKNQEGSGHEDSTQSIPSTPDRYCTALTYKCLGMGKCLVFINLDSDTSEESYLPWCIQYILMSLCGNETKSFSINRFIY